MLFYFVLSIFRVFVIVFQNFLPEKKYPADFIYKNLMIEANVIQAAYRAEVKRLLFLGELS
jgi:nucleoside-diphosphate-sugar epimerase